MNYNTVAASQTAQALIGTSKAGAKGDIVKRLIVTVATSATGTVALLDNATSIPITAANTPIGVYIVDLDVTSKEGAWKITTGAGATVVAVGEFS